MAAKFIPAGDRYLVTVLDQEKMLDGLHLPDSSKDDMKAGIVAATAPTIFLEGTTTRISGPRYQVGDQVLFGPWAGKEIQLEGVPFRILREEEIDGKVVDDN